VENENAVLPSTMWKDENGHIIVVGVALSEFEREDLPFEIRHRIIYHRVDETGYVFKDLISCSLAAFQLRFTQVMIDHTEYAINDGPIYEE
jgi:hypothetical protein